MKFVALVSAFLLPVVTLAYGPSPLLADDGRDLSFLLKRYDGPAPILHRAVKGKRHIIPRTLQSSPDDGYAVYSKCLDAAYVPCPDGSQCCPAGYVCGPGSCCPAGNLVCTGNCCPDVRGDCCPSVGCCPAGQVCFTAANGAIGCCPRGQACTATSRCVDPTAVACPGESFCCRPGTTCSRDAARNAVCLSPSGDQTVSANGINASPTPGGNNIINVNNTNILKSGVAFRQIPAASGLMVAVAFLSLLGLGFCSQEC